MSLRPTIRNNRGFTMVTAIFILVVLAALGAAIVNISTSQQIGSTLDVQGAQAYQAARAGIEWGAYQVQSTAAYNFGHTSTDPNTRACPTATSFVPTAPALSGFTVSVTCTALPVPNPNNDPTVYQITSTACNRATCPVVGDPGANYIERRLVVSL